MLARVTSHAGRALRWDSNQACWRWAGVGAPTLHALAAANRQIQTSKLPDRATVLVPCRSGRLLLGLPKRLCLAALDPARAHRPLRMQALVAVDPAEPRTGISDGCTDRRGNLVFGTGTDAPRCKIGSFYQYSLAHGLRRLALPVVAQAASICFSADGARMYFADAAQHRILQCDYDADQATVSDIRPFAMLPAGAVPHSSVLDTEGCLWNAQSGRLARYSPAGILKDSFEIDCRAPAFGGAGLAELLAAGTDGVVSFLTHRATGIPDTLFDDDVFSYAG